MPAKLTIREIISKIRAHSNIGYWLDDYECESLIKGAVNEAGKPLTVPDKTSPCINSSALLTEREAAALQVCFPIHITPRSLQFGGKRISTWSGKVTFFRDKSAQAYLNEIALKVRPFRPAKPLEGAFRVKLKFWMPRPKAMKSESAEPLAKRPDLDNLAKPAIDVLTREGFWLDDAQIYELTLRKFICSIDMNPRIDVEILEVKV